MTDTPRVFLAAYHDGLSPRYEVVPEGAMGAEEFVPKGTGVRVKALEWKDEGSDDWSAHCPVFGDLYVLSSKSRDDMSAKREARIRAALELTTEPEPTSAPVDPENLALRFHELYEKLAPSFGYETRADTRVFDPDSQNGQLMIAVCAALQPTSGAYDMICCTAEDVATGRGFTGDAKADLAMAQESLRDCLKLLGWRG